MHMASVHAAPCRGAGSEFSAIPGDIDALFPSESELDEGMAMRKPSYLLDSCWLTWRANSCNMASAFFRITG